MGRKPTPAKMRTKVCTVRASGATLREAAAAAGVSRAAGHHWLAQSGGVRRRSAAASVAAVVAGGARNDLMWAGPEEGVHLRVSGGRPGDRRDDERGKRQRRGVVSE